MVKNEISMIDGKKIRGLSKANQICIGIATDGIHTYCAVEGNGAPSGESVLRIFGEHIQPGSVLHHDGDAAHAKLIKALGLNDIVHIGKELKGIEDKKNPMDPVNDKCDFFKKLIRSHPGFARDDLPDYCNLFMLIANPPFDVHEKIDMVLMEAMHKHIVLRYRDNLHEFNDK